MAIDFNDFEYAMPGQQAFGVATGEHRRVQMGDYGSVVDLRTGPELAAARMDVIEQRLRHIETLLHQIINATESASRL